MLRIIIHKEKRKKSHIEKANKVSLCGKRFNKKVIKSIIDGNAEQCTCQMCLNTLATNIKLYE